MRVVIHKEGLRWKRYSFIEIFIKTKTKILLCFLKRKERNSYVKVKKKVRDEEGGKSENDEKRLCTMKWKEE